MTAPARVGDALAAAAVAWVLSGVPSTAHALLTGRSPLEAGRAAGELLGARSLTRGLVAHTGLSLGWASVMVATLPRRHRLAWGAAGGLAIAALDLGVVGRRYPSIRRLPGAPLVADHLAFGLLVAAVVRHREGNRLRPGPSSLGTPGTR